MGNKIKQNLNQKNTVLKYQIKKKDIREAMKLVKLKKTPNKIA